MNKNLFHTDWLFRKKDQKDWIKITLPHDAMLFEERKKDSPGGSASGFFTGGEYEYQKTMVVPAEWKEDYIALEFEGIYNQSEVRINGKPVGGSRYGYRNYIVEIAALLNYGGENIISVRAVNNLMPNSRWYTGSGIYRPVYLIHGGRNHIKPYGVKISTLSCDPARVRVEVHCSAVENANLVCRVQILDQGKMIMQTTCTELETTETARRNRTFAAELTVPDSRLWSESNPELYTCKAVLLSDNSEQDSVYETFGIRKIEWSTKGLFINGEETLLRGACVHHDNGVLGAASYPKSEERRVRILKEQGYNAIRSSHNPASTAMVEACDKLGMLLIDEAWDMWYGHKNKYDYADVFMEEYEKDLESIIMRDFNHPSVIMYSLGNEVSEPKDEKGIILLKKMVDFIHREDPARPATAGINLMVIEMASKGKGVYKEEGGRSDSDRKTGKPKKERKSGSIFFNMMTSVVGTNMNKMANSKHADRVTSPCLDALDIAGYNYASGRYPLEAQAHPNRIIFGSETFPQDIWKNWQMVKKYPYLLGDFMWTGWDYIGEAGIGAWAYGNASGFDKEYPWLLADTGAIDITGYAGAESYYAATVWGLRENPYIGVRPVNHPGVRPLKSTWRGTNAFSSWSYRNCRGNRAVVEVYSNAAVIGLSLNGRQIGRKKVTENKAVFKLKYEPGILTATAYDITGSQLSQSSLASAEGELELSLLPEEEVIKAGDIVYIPVCITDRKGTVECNADTDVKVTVEGGTLLGFGSAKPCTTERYISGQCGTYYGRALAVVLAEKAGTIRVMARAENGMKAMAQIEVAN